MISRRPMWMLLVTCALLSSGSSTMALAASQAGQGSESTNSHQGELLLSQTTEAAEEESSPEESAGKLDRPTLSMGSNGPLVIQIQVLLQEQGLYDGTINGDFDADTVAAVKTFQTDNGLEPTGSLDSATWGPLTGEDVEPEAALPGEGSPTPEPTTSDAGPSTNMRLIIAAAALIGLGAGGFGLWKMLSVPVSKPLVYPDSGDEDDDYMDDLAGEPVYAAQAMEPPLRTPRSQNISPTNVPTSRTAQAPQPAGLAEEMAEDLDVEEADYSGLEEIDLPESPGLFPGTVAPAVAEEEVPGRIVTITEPRKLSAVEALFEPVQPEVATSLKASHQKKIDLQQDVVQDATGQTLTEAQVSAAQKKLKQESPTDAAVAIATQNARAAAARQKAPTAPANKTIQSAVQPVATVASSKSKSAKATRQPKAGLTQTRSAKAARNKSGRAFQTPPPPPPAPSEIVRAAPEGSLEQPELVTTPLRGRVDIVETLITDLQGADPAKRRKAIWELGQRCDSRAIQPLVNMMANSDSRQRSLILAALSEIGTQTLKPMKQALAISLQDDNAEVRKNAIRDLTRIYDLVAQISHLLNSALDDPDPEVQDTARWALKQLNRIRSNAGLEGSADQPILQQSVSPPESFSGKGTFKPRSLPKS